MLDTSTKHKESPAPKSLQYVLAAGLTGKRTKVQLPNKLELLPFSCSGCSKLLDTAFSFLETWMAQDFQSLWLLPSKLLGSIWHARATLCPAVVG